VCGLAAAGSVTPFLAEYRVHGGVHG